MDAAHVGHKVMVNGHILHRSEPKEAKFAGNEKQQAQGKPYADFHVSGLKMMGHVLLITLPYASGTSLPQIE